MRREEIAEALWRVVRRDGVGAATVRSIAAEAGWSPGALRHYFSTRAELLAFAMEHVITRVRARIETTDFRGPVRVAVRALAEEGELAGHRDAEFEAARLHALIDGLTIHVLARPDSMPPDRVSAVLAAHLEDLAT
nr:TetR family transcriptional regulator C-terminal domain-containing protein [Microbispora sp. NBRC 16548]